MKLYRLEATINPDDGEAPFVNWVGTQADVSKTRKQMMKDHGFKRSEIEVEEVEVPTNKVGLLEFLNNNSV